MLLRFIKKYAEILSLGGFLAYWFWDAKLSAAFSDFGAKDWMSMANTLATLILSLVALYGIISWKKEYKDKRCSEAAFEFAEEVSTALAALKNITHQYQSPGPFTDANLSHAERRRHDLLIRLDHEIELFNNLFANRFRYKLLLGNDASNICKKIRTLVADIQLACDEYVDYSRMLAELPPDYEVDGLFFNNLSVLEENKKKRVQFSKAKKEYSNWMSLGRNSIVEPKINELQEKTDAILKANTF